MLNVDVLINASLIKVICALNNRKYNVLVYENGIAAIKDEKIHFVTITDNKYHIDTHDYATEKLLNTSSCKTINEVIFICNTF